MTMPQHRLICLPRALSARQASLASAASTDSTDHYMQLQQLCTKQHHNTTSQHNIQNDTNTTSLTMSHTKKKGWKCKRKHFLCYLPSTTTSTNTRLQSSPAPQSHDPASLGRKLKAVFLLFCHSCIWPQVQKSTRWSGSHNSTGVNVRAIQNRRTPYQISSNSWVTLRMRLSIRRMDTNLEGRTMWGSYCSQFSSLYHSITYIIVDISLKNIVNQCKTTMYCNDF